MNYNPHIYLHGLMLWSCEGCEALVFFLC